jgi:glycosyltransferase involved in cell wall biosynthesis
MSTYPIATAHAIGWTLHRLTKIPWVAEFRDPMIDGTAHRDAVVRMTNRWVERRSATASAAVFVTPSAREDYARRYPAVAPSRLHVIPNGYDEQAFEGAPSAPNRPVNGRPVRLLHSGILYPQERDPRPFFAALRDLKANTTLAPRSLEILFRAPGYEDHYHRLIAEHDVADIVRLAPSVPYREAVAEMVAADGLLLFQATAVNLQIPAKVYEYIRARRPVFALTDPAGDTASMLAEAGVGTVARLDSVADIREKFPEFLRSLRRGEVRIADEATVPKYSRRARARDLARVLNGVTVGLAGR